MHTHIVAILAISVIMVAHLLVIREDGFLTFFAVGSVAGLGGYSAFEHFRGRLAKNRRGR